MRIRTFATTTASAGLIFLTACGGSAPAPMAPPPAPMESFPSSPPAPLPVEDVDFPDFAERTLRNGARLIVVENHEQPVVSISLLLPGAGSAADPDGRSGLASLTASQLDKGTRNRTAAELAEASDFIGASLGAGAGTEWASASLTVVTDFLDEGLELFGDMLLNPVFPEEELATEKQRRISSLRLSRSQPGTLAQQTFMEEIYGDHPYGDFETAESISEIDAADLEAFYEARYRPGNALIVVAGDVNPDRIARQLEVALAGWEGRAPADVAGANPPTRPAGREMVFVHKPGSVQAVIRVGHLFPSADQADWAALDVANNILGAGGFTSWMMSILREERGYTYGARSTMSERAGPGYFMMTGEFRNEVADSSLIIMMDLAERLRRGEVDASDIESARLYLTGRFPRTIETPGQVAGQVASNRLLGRPDSYLEEYRGRVAGIELADIRQAAQQHIHPDNALIVVVGDATEILGMLRPLADRVRVVDTEGEPLDADALIAAAEASAGMTFDASGLSPVELTYAAMAQGNQVATITSSWTRDGGDMVVANTQALPQISITSTTTFDAASFAPRSMITDVGPMGSFQIMVEDGRATGRGLNMQTGQPQDIDVAIEDGVYLDGMLDVALAVSDLEEMTEFTMKVLTGSGTIQGTSVSVTGEETVEVPAGTFETYRVEISGQQPMVVWVTKSDPHIVVKRELVGQPVEIVLTEMN